jgi:hypothetical protein
MTLRRVVCLALLLAAPGPQGGPAAAPARKPPAVGLVIWGGGPKPEDAQAAAAELDTSGLASSEPIRILSSSDVRGLPPGFQVAVLGACPRAQAEKLLEPLRLFRRHASVRYVPLEGAVAELQCPKLHVVMTPLPDEEAESEDAAQAAPAAEVSQSDGEAAAEQWKPRVTVRVKAVAAGKFKLRVKVTEVDESSSGEEDTRRWSAVIELYRGKTLLSSEVLERPVWAVVERFESGTDGITLDTNDTDSNCGRGDIWDGAKVHRLFKIGRGEVVTKTKEDPDFGLCPPNPEGADPDMERVMFRRYNALEPYCKGPESKERCLRAMAKYDAKHPRGW